MSNKISCDIAIIGAGSGGLSLAAGASQLGAKVVLIEKDKMGGDCLNTGCVPSKALLAAAKRYWQARHSSHLGVEIKACNLNFTQVMEHVKQVIATIEVNDSVQRFESLGVKVIKQPARFIDERTVKAGKYQINAKKIVIATGSCPSIPLIDGIDTVSYLTNESIFELNELPSNLIIIGGGPIGCELAQAFSMLGSQVTLLEGIKLLNNDEDDCVNLIFQSLIDKGVQVHERVTIESVSEKEGEIRVNTSQQ